MAQKRKRSRSPAPSRDALAGLRDVLEITLSRVIDGDLDTREARKLLAHLTKELDAIERRARKPSGGR